MKQTNKIVPNIWYHSDEGKIAEIIAYYKNIFGNAFQDGQVIPLGDTPSGNTEMCVVYIFGQNYMLMSKPNSFEVMMKQKKFVIEEYTK